MDIVRRKTALADAIRALRRHGKTIGFVPTMGALHDGHISLVHIAQAHADAVVASVFVNPMQFGPNEDFSKYPRTEAEDLQKLEAAGVGIAYLPTVEEMYPEGATTRVQVPGINADLEGAVRPGHFDGVATIVCKLFMQALPDVAVFGEKDYQQLCVIRRFAGDLDVPVRIIGGETLREPDGLAMSSRNRYLNDKERAIAPVLYKIIKETMAKLSANETIAGTLDSAQKSLLAAGFDKVDYLDLRDADTFTAVTEMHKRVRLLAAARLGTTRLIDNIGT